MEVKKSSETTLTLTLSPEEMIIYDYVVVSKGNNFFPSFIAEFLIQRKHQRVHDLAQDIQRDILALDEDDREEAVKNLNDIRKKVGDKKALKDKKKEIKKAEKQLAIARGETPEIEENP